MSSSGVAGDDISEETSSQNNSKDSNNNNHNLVDYNFRVVLVGDCNVGKSFLLRRLIEGDALSASEFVKTSESHDTSGTIGVDFKSKTFILDHNNVKICLNFYDTSGNKKFLPITKSYFLNVQAFLIVYDVNDMTSFLNCQTWLDEINRTYFNSNYKNANSFSSNQNGNNKDKLIKILIGCKADLNNEQHQKVQSKKAKEFAKKNGFILFYETSAKDNVKINELFNELCLELISNYLNFINFQRFCLDPLNTLPPEFKTLMLNKNTMMPLPALMSKSEVFFDCQTESLNCSHIILNNTNAKRKNLQTKGILLNDLFDLF